MEDIDKLTENIKHQIFPKRIERLTRTIKNKMPLYFIFKDCDFYLVHSFRGFHPWSLRAILEQNIMNLGACGEGQYLHCLDRKQKDQGAGITGSSFSNINVNVCASN